MLSLQAAEAQGSAAASDGGNGRSYKVDGCCHALMEGNENLINDWANN